MSYFGFDTTRPPFDDVRVRRAFALALDRERLVPLAEGASSTYAASLVPPAIWPDGFAPETEHDPDEARRLLDEAGYEDRADLGTIVVSGAGLGVGPAVEVWREELGVDIEIEVMGFGDYLATLDSKPPGIFTVNWIADYPSPHAIYGLLLEPGAASNYGDWNDDHFAQLLRGRGARARVGGRAPPTMRSTPTLPSRPRSSLGRTARPGGSSPTDCAGWATSRSVSSTSGGCRGTADPLAGAAAAGRPPARSRGRCGRRLRRLRDVERRLDLRPGDPVQDHPERRQPRPARAPHSHDGDGGLARRAGDRRRVPPPNTCGTRPSITSCRTR